MINKLMNLKPSWVIEAETTIAAFAARRAVLIETLTSALPKNHPLRLNPDTEWHRREFDETEKRILGLAA